VADLIYTAIASLDGYVNDADGTFEWAAPDEQVHSFVNDLERPTGTYLYGRRLYETMRFWDEDSPEIDASPASRDYATLWRQAEKVVYSTSLTGVDTPRTRHEREFDPSAVTALKAAANADVSVGGPHLAAAALAAGLVDELRLFVVTHVVGGGTRWLPEGLRLGLRLLEERRFDSGTVFLRYRLTA
jgi:dihydrofolate reductase